MKIKNLVLALSIITVGTFVTVLAQKNLIKLSSAGWFSGSAQAAQPKAPAFYAAEPLVHDGDHYPTSGTFNNTLSNAQVSEHQDGDIVVVMSAAGELPGTLTLKLRRNADSTTITGGEWAFNVSYTEEIHNEDGSHGELLVQRGTLKGTITGGQMTLNSDGSLTSINSVQLSLNGGTLTFNAATTGTGSGQAGNINDSATSTGTLNLSF